MVEFKIENMKSSIYKPPRPVDVNSLNNSNGNGNSKNIKKENRGWFSQKREEDLEWDKDGSTTRKQIPSTPARQKGSRGGGSAGERWNKTPQVLGSSTKQSALQADAEEFIPSSSSSRLPLNEQQMPTQDKIELQQIQADLNALLRTVNRRYEKPRMSATASKLLTTVMSQLGNIQK